MLVLSRKQNESIQFPNLGIAVEILRVAGNTVRVGIDAPADVRILRGELTEHANTGPKNSESREKRHLMRNRLNSATLALHLLEKQLELGKYENAEATLKQALKTFAELDQLASTQVDVATRKDHDGCHALIVDDNVNERELLAGYLRLCGYTVDGVEDGLAALNYLEHHECPDVVLLDMQMPRMNGPETIKAIRINPDYRDIKVFAVSGMDPHSAKVALGHRGVDRWFSKPIKPAEFAAQLGREIEQGCHAS